MFIPLVAGVPLDPAVSIQKCIDTNVTKVMFPWPIWAHTSRVKLNRRCDIPSQASASVPGCFKFNYKLIILILFIQMHNFINLYTGNATDCRHTGACFAHVDYGYSAHVSQLCCAPMVRFWDRRMQAGRHVHKLFPLACQL